MRLYLHNNSVKRNSWMPVSEIANLEFIWEVENDNYHSLVIYDIDAKSSPYIHLFVTNIPGNTIREGNYNFTYVPPKPPRNDPNHRYIIALFEQEELVNEIKPFRRTSFPLEKIIKENGLSLLDDEVLEVDPLTLMFYLRDKEDDPLDVIHPLLMPDSQLSDKEKKYCDCVEKVSVKQPSSCLTDKISYERREGKVCVDPYKVCAYSVGTTSRKCSTYYNYDEMTDKQLIAYANLHNKSIPTPYNRKKLLITIKSTI